MSGPSGIGKSCVTLLVAIHIKMVEHENVLYVPYGEPLDRAQRIKGNSQTPITEALMRLFVEFLCAQNEKELIDEMFPVGQGLSVGKFVEKLNEKLFIIFIDEQGHAFMDLERRNVLYLFGMLHPNFYISEGRKLRVLSTGSNHASFEISLNGEYWKCLYYVQPMTETEAAAFNEGYRLDLAGDEICFLCNYVPREMRLLSEALSQGTTRNSHLKNRASDMEQALAGSLKKERTSSGAVSMMVTYLFRDKSLGHHGSILAPFIHLGFVYRSKTEDGLIGANPLCLAAETALIGLWKIAG